MADGGAHMDPQSRFSFCADRWHLHDLTRLAGGFRSDVYSAVTSSGDEVVLKVAATPEEARAEVAALRVWDDTGATVHLLDVDVDHSALLLERIRPATPMPPNDDEVAIGVVADILSKVHGAPFGTFPFPTLEQIYPWLARGSVEDAAHEQQVSGDPTRGLPGLQRLDRARAAAMHLCATTTQPVLLHGDILDKNLLWNGTGYVAIDPIPRIGDPCSDVGFFASCHHPAAGILERAVAIAGLMNLDAHRAQQWAAIWAVLEACSAWRPDQPALEACLGSHEFEELLPG